LLLLVPSLAGLVGGVVLPLLGAIPDGAIMLFSGIGDIESAQETLSVGVGALAGSTIMLLTVPWGMSVWAGRVDLMKHSTGKVEANYKGDPKLSENQSLSESGVSVGKETKHGAKVMMLTTIPYFLIQIPASYLQEEHSDDIAGGEKWWALLALIVCVGGFVWYLMFHIKASKDDEQKFRRMEVMKEMLITGKLSLGGIFHDLIKTYDNGAKAESNSQYQSIEDGSSEPNAKVMEYLTSVLSVTFQKYDMDGDASLGKREFKLFLKDFNEEVSKEDIDMLFEKYDQDNNGEISLDEFVLACYSILTTVHKEPSMRQNQLTSEESTEVGIAMAAMETAAEDADEEKEEIPHDIASLAPADQEAAVKKKAFIMLGIGTFLVLLFSGKEPTTLIMFRTFIFVDRSRQI